MKPEHERAQEIGERLGEMELREMDERTIECEDFYNSCQRYRFAEDQESVISAYKNLIEYVDARAAMSLEARQQALQGLADALKSLLQRGCVQSYYEQKFREARAALAAAKPFREKKS